MQHKSQAPHPPGRPGGWAKIVRSHGRSVALKGQVTPRTLLLVEFASQERWVYNSRFFPFIKGCAESLGVRSDWVCFGADMKTEKLSRTRIRQFRDLPPAELEVLRARVKALRPTHIITTHPVSRAVLDALAAGAAKGASLLTVSDPDLNSTLGDEILVALRAKETAKSDWLLEWLGERPESNPGFGKYLVGTYRPSYDAFIGNDSFREYKPHLLIVGGILCDHRTKLQDHPRYKGLDLSGCQHDFGCGFCTHDRNFNSDPAADPMAAATEQFRRIVETSGDRGRDFGQYDLCDIRLFSRIDELFEMILRAGVRPGTFHFEPRVDKFLKSADKLEALLPRLAAAGHRVSLFRMGAESLVEEENELYNKRVTLAQLDAATARSRALMEKFPSAFDCDPTYGYISCSPWTTLEMFEEGVKRAMARGWDPKGVWLYTPLLFYTDAPLTAVALREGGIIQKAHADLELLYEPAVNESGFDSFLPWKFKDERMAAAFALIVRFCAAALRDKYPDTLFSDDELYAEMLARESGMPFYERPDAFAVEAIAAVKAAAPPYERDALMAEALDAYDARRRPAAPAAPEGNDRTDWSELTLTRRCNQRCFFCYEDARDIATDPDIEEVKRLLRETRKRAEMVVLCGKEVTLRRDILDIVSYASSIGLQVAVFSNGQELSRPGLVQKLVEAGCADVVVSFHFPDQESFGRGARVHPRGFRKIIEGLGNVRRFIEENPGGTFGVSTETGMFSVNAGRLDEVRRTLREALGDKEWAMRLGSLLPTKIHDIGLPHVMEPFDERRAELAEFVRTHPPHIPLNFVKVPLCMLPPEAVHKSLDVQHVHEAALMTFNHAAMDEVTVDTLSPSLASDVTEKLRAHPYRWVCRSCDLVSLCRFERVSWIFPFFEPTREQKPRPIPGLTAAKVLARLGPAPAARERARKIGAALKKIRYPEELLLAALRGKGGAALTITDAWIERDPVMVVEARAKGKAAPLRLNAPRKKDGAVPLHAIIDYLDVGPATGAPASLKTLAPLLDAVAAKRLPPLETWKDDLWFDQSVAALFRSAWRAFGRALWPGVGKIAGWDVDAVSLLPETRLLVALRHGASRADLTYGTAGEATLTPVVRPAGTPSPDDAYARLVAELKPRTGRAAPAGDAPFLARVRARLFSPSGEPVSLGGHVAASVEPGPGRGAIVILKARAPGPDGDEAVFVNVEPLDGALRYFKAVGDLAFGYSDATPLKTRGQLTALAALISRLTART